MINFGEAGFKDSQKCIQKGIEDYIYIMLLKDHFPSFFG
jgi:hypothetical protein